MAVIMAIGFYTTRILLHNLGVVNYGVFNVVGGVITLLGFVTSSMSGSIQRFITYELGRNEGENVKAIFGTAVLIQILFSLILAILAETIGLWFLKTQMQIPPNQEQAAFWVFQCSILTTIIAIMSIPYMSLIIAKEKMGVFAYISILEASLKLFIVFAIAWLPFNRLICYSVLLVGVQLVIRCCYTIYCKCKYNEAHAKIRWNASLIKEIGGFAGWTTLGSFASVLYTQGINIILNLFFGPIVNAARGVAVQLQSAVNQFCISFQTAINPQITKSVAGKDFSYMTTLVCNSSKFSFYLIFLITLPLLLCAKELLSVWLEQIPNHTIVFVKLIVIIVWINALSNPLTTAAMATGQIKYYQIFVGGLLLLIVPVAYTCLKLGCSPYSVFIVIIIIELCAHVMRLYFLRKLIEFRIEYYIKKVWLPILTISVMSGTLMLGFRYYITHYYIAVCLASIICSIVSIYFGGLTNDEKCMIKSKICNIVHKNYL